MQFFRVIAKTQMIAKNGGGGEDEGARPLSPPLNLPLYTMRKGSRPEAFCEKAVLKNFSKFTGKHLFFGVSFLNKASSLQLY